MRFRHISSNAITLWVPVTIKAKDLNLILSSADTARYLYFEIQLCINATPSDEGWVMEYTGQWATPPVGNYPTRILDAIEKHLATTNVCEKFKTAINNEITNI